MGAELTRDFIVEGDEERLEARRRNLYTLLAIPRSVEQFVAYGFFQCTDAFLYLFTILPLRFLIALKSIILRPLYTLVRYVTSFSGTMSPFKRTPGHDNKLFFFDSQ